MVNTFKKFPSGNLFGLIVIVSWIFWYNLAFQFLKNRRWKDQRHINLRIRLIYISTELTIFCFLLFVHVF